MMFRYFSKILILAISFWFLSGCSSTVTGPSDGVDIESLSSYQRYEHQRQLVSSRGVSRLPSPALTMNKAVEKELRCFLKGNGRFLKDSLERRSKYLPIMSQIFEDEGVPHELLNLAMIESGYNVHARSRVGAVGMWQFMKSTARIYGLSVGLFEDQRKDPILSTIAAARHLKDLYSIYKDWYLALAAYNAGPGAVQKALAKGGPVDFWNLANKGRLTKQTRDFIPRFIAAALIAKDPSAYGIPQNDSMAMMAQLNLPKASDESGVPEELNSEGDRILEAQKNEERASTGKTPDSLRPTKIDSPRGPHWTGNGRTSISFRTTADSRRDSYTP